MNELGEFKFFEISAYAINLFSFMMGMAFAFFKQSFFGKKIGGYVFLYFAGLAMWYAGLYYAATHGIKLNV